MFPDMQSLEKKKQIISTPLVSIQWSQSQLACNS